MEILLSYSDIGLKMLAFPIRIDTLKHNLTQHSKGRLDVLETGWWAQALNLLLSKLS